MREMKNSGIEWLQNIPASWDIVPNKYLMYKTKSICPVYSGEDILSLTMNGVIVRDLNAGGKMPTSFDGYQQIKAGNLLMCLFDIDVTPRCIGLIKQSGLTSPAYSQFVLKEGADAAYYCYYYTMLDNDKTLLHLAKNLRHSLTEEQLGAVPTALPPISEQQSIAAYLDRKCAEIDTLTADIETQIETLEQYKRSVITEAVTKGLNPDVEMKDSGIEWVGKVPKHWGISQLKFYVESITDVDHYMPESIEKGIPYVMTGDLKDQFSLISFEECKQISEEDFNQLIKKSNIKIGNVIFARYATIGTVCYVDAYRDCVISYSCVNITPGQRLNGYFLFYYLKSNSFEEDVSKFVNSNTQGNVGIESLKQSQISVPPFEEQKEIANYLDHKCTEIDSIIADKRTQLDTLAEYKKSLIYEYVTGKKEVPV